MKWPTHRTSINRTLTIAKRDSTVQAIITSGLKSSTSTVNILQGIIAVLYAEKLLLTHKIEELSIQESKR